VPASERLVRRDGRLHREVRWHAEDGGNVRLAAIAREVIDLMSSPERLARLRRCANPECSMLFLAASSRRQWCTANVCGNRARVARHYQRHRTQGATD
jgi:predicted RNA-binding Zn ribbon-like protein